MTHLSGILRKSPSGVYTYDIGADSVLVFPLASKLQERFQLEAGQLPIFGLDTILVELTKDDLTIVVGWDIWSELFIMAGEVKANGLLKEISKYLDSIMKELGDLEDKLIAESKEENTK